MIKSRIEIPNFRVSSSSFSGLYARLNGTRTLPISRLGAIKFAYSIGLPALRRAMPTSAHAIAFANYKIMGMKCAIDFTGASLRVPAEYKLLDSTEKANISYWTGMIFSALVADQMLGVPRLIHASLIDRTSLTRRNPLSRGLADLVGEDASGGWHVVEAKGRQRRPSSKTKALWKGQATTIIAINGNAPSTCSYCLALVGNPYSVYLVDPPPDDDETHTSIEIDSHNLVSQYYSPLREWLADGVRNIVREGIPLVVKQAAFDPLNDEFVFLGLRQDVLDMLDGAAQSDMVRVAPHMGFDLADSYIGSDGIAVVTSQSQNIS